MFRFRRPYIEPDNDFCGESQRAERDGQHFISHLEGRLNPRPNAQLMNCRAVVAKQRRNLV
jgi:hypothetical protein